MLNRQVSKNDASIAVTATYSSMVSGKGKHVTAAAAAAPGASQSMKSVASARSSASLVSGNDKHASTAAAAPSASRSIKSASTPARASLVSGNGKIATAGVEARMSALASFHENTHHSDEFEEVVEAMPNLTVSPDHVVTRSKNQKSKY